MNDSIYYLTYGIDLRIECVLDLANEYRSWIWGREMEEIKRL